jgi:hypothetical protein
MTNVLNENEKHQLVAPRRRGWSVRHIEEATKGRREVACAYTNQRRSRAADSTAKSVFDGRMLKGSDA